MVFVFEGSFGSLGYGAEIEACLDLCSHHPGGDLEGLGRAGHEDSGDEGRAAGRGDRDGQ